MLFLIQRYNELDYFENIIDEIYFFKNKKILLKEITEKLFNNFLEYKKLCTDLTNEKNKIYKDEIINLFK